MQSRYYLNFHYLIKKLTLIFAQKCAGVTRESSTRNALLFCDGHAYRIKDSYNHICMYMAKVKNKNKTAQKYISNKWMDIKNDGQQNEGQLLDSKA